MGNVQIKSPEDIKREKLEAEQLKLLQEMQTIRYNIVTCANCGAVVICKGDSDVEFTCYSCFEEIRPEDCPDFWY